MFTLNNKTESTVGPYNGSSIAASGTLTITGAAAPYLSDGALLADIIGEKVTVTFTGRESFGAAAAALLMQLGQLYNTDSDGANLSRVKQAPSGWSYQLRAMEFCTAKLSSLVNEDYTGTPMSDATIKFYDEDGVQITAEEDMAGCVKTQVDLEPPYDYYILGGSAKPLTVPEGNIRLSIIGAPDIPAIMGGSKLFISNVNFKYIAPGSGIQADGRAAKWLQYNATYHTNKMRFVLLHDAGVQMDFMLMLELFRQ